MKMYCCLLFVNHLMGRAVLQFVQVVNKLQEKCMSPDYAYTKFKSKGKGFNKGNTDIILTWTISIVITTILW